MTETADEKHFDAWMGLKNSLHQTGKMRSFHEGEVWWCALGENVGIEINGKSRSFARPVIILKKLSRYGFQGIPLTSQPHTGSWYVHFKFQGKDEYAVLSQMRTFSVSRLYQRMGRVDEEDLEVIKSQFHDLYCTNHTPSVGRKTTAR